MPKGIYDREDLKERFWSKVDKESDSQGCWLWNAGRFTQGYGQFWMNGKNKKAHVIAYLLSGNVIPKGLVLGHSGICKGKPHCCNPEHLTPITQKQNNGQDKERDGTDLKGERHPRSKLTDTYVQEIRQSVKTVNELSIQYGMSRSHIAAIKNGNSWKHL
jgi:hypothetical protein